MNSDCCLFESMEAKPKEPEALKKEEEREKKVRMSAMSGVDSD